MTTAPDIHIEPQEDGLLFVRYRIDGVLHVFQKRHESR